MNIIRNKDLAHETGKRSQGYKLPQYSENKQTSFKGLGGPQDVSQSGHPANRSDLAGDNNEASLAVSITNNEPQPGSGGVVGS